MPRERGYVSSLLSNLAADYAKKAREGLVAPILFPRVPVGKALREVRGIRQGVRVQSPGRNNGR